MIRTLTTLTFVTLSVLAPLSMAADDRDPQIQQHLAQTRARLNLSDEQLGRLTPVLEESMAQRRRILASYGIDLENGGTSGKFGLRQARAMREEMDVVRTDTLARVDDILNDEQLDGFKRMMDERRSEMRARIRGGRS